MITIREAEYERLQLFESLVEGARNYAIFMLDPEGYVLSWNEGAARMKGYSASQILGQHFSRFYTSDDISAGHPAHGLRTARAEGKFEEDGWRVRRDGSRFLANVLITVRLGEEGQVRGFAKLTRDITERKRSERLLERARTDVVVHKRLNEEMERCVDERTVELRGSLSEKITLLKEVHHRVKNNLQVVCSLLSMQIACLAGDSSSRPLEDAHSRVVAMSLIHEQIYQTETLNDLEFGGYIEALSGLLFSAYCVDPSRIRLELSLDAISLTVDQAVPCGLILNEMLSNSLKHAFSDGRTGVITISLRKTEAGHVTLTVSDNGVGLPPGFRWDESRSLGLQVVRALTHQIRADVLVTGNSGTQFEFCWKLA